LTKTLETSKLAGMANEPEKMEQISVYVDRDVKQRLDVIVSRSGGDAKRQTIIRAALRDFCKRTQRAGKLSISLK
tara:strand:+ start:1103 stop:1327 length:225 start_codon:yes stop_codon:yes gene_type:complete